jgi:imidazolonepropionase-like amidohydrolase
MLAQWHRRLCTPCLFARVAGIVSSLVMSSLVVLPVRGQQSTAQDSRVIHAGRLFDAHSGKMLEGRDILVRGNRIEKVGPNLQVPSGAHEFDLRNATVLPGFIDVHTHRTSNPGDSGYSSLGISVPRQALTGARNAKLTLLAGFAAVRNVGAAGYSDVALRDAINDGDIVGPRMRVSGPPLGISGGIATTACSRLSLSPKINCASEFRWLSIPIFSNTHSSKRRSATTRSASSAK